ncbi:MAG: creatinine amidohydrolase [Phormidesmis priestleyi Ana]|uniref:Creatinine amidohydrolase n=1 Tax=Phormidesmis priestleyi Ana TaxID=1666911 RepID=A0A0P7ZK00_9CYAN|nr:MAG: creatinine amidohydrolase [Phormidesmis priestleyi Ana]
MHSYIPPARFFAYLTWAEISAIPDKANTLIIQPIGAVEQHGPHLPLIVDSVIATAVVGKALSELAHTVPAYALPTLCYGKSNEHKSFPGTVTLSAQTLMSVLTEMAEGIYQAGFRKLVFVNAHGGQPQVLEIVARDLRERFSDLAVFPLSVWGAPHCAAEVVGAQEYLQGIHAGDVETSVLLSLLPDQVKMSKALREFPPSFAAGSLLSLEGQLPTAWTMNDLSQSGVVGDATVATAEKGERILASLTAGWVRIFEEIYLFRGLNPVAEH